MTDEVHPHDQWVKCPHCLGRGYEPLAPLRVILDREWCSICLPTRHESNLTLPWKQLTMAWHWDRDQRPGKVRVAQEVIYALDPRRQG